MLRALIPLTIALGFIFWIAHVVLGAVICAVILAYFVSLVVHPNRDCISCGGRKTHGPEGSKNFRRCWTCGGDGHYPRLGVKIFRRNVIARIKDGSHVRNI